MFRIRKFLTVERARTFRDSDLPLPASLNGFAAKWNMIALVRLSSGVADIAVIRG